MPLFAGARAEGKNAEPLRRFQREFYILSERYILCDVEDSCLVGRDKDYMEALHLFGLRQAGERHAVRYCVKRGGDG